MNKLIFINFTSKPISFAAQNTVAAFPIPFFPFTTNEL